MNKRVTMKSLKLVFLSKFSLFVVLFITNNFVSASPTFKLVKQEAMTYEDGEKDDIRFYKQIKNELIDVKYSYFYSPLKEDRVLYIEINNIVDEKSDFIYPFYLNINDISLINSFKLKGRDSVPLPPPCSLDGSAKVEFRELIIKPLPSGEILTQATLKSVKNVSNPSLNCGD